jgi:hypothetical protein
MTDFTSKTFRETYRDFYDANDGYYRVLYNSGRALQARELIEQQTIIQEEIARFGQNIFKEGAMVNPGGATVNNKVEYIRLDSVSVTTPDLFGVTLTNGTIEFKIVEIVPATNTDPETLYVQYTDTSAVTDTEKAPRVSTQEIITRVDNVSVNLKVIDDSSDPIPAAGRGTKAHFSSGDFFIQGHFVYLEKGDTFISKYSDTPEEDFGFRIEQKIVTEGDDEQLYDNQGQVPDHTAPGAHRYQIKLIPTTRELFNARRVEFPEEESNFIFIARIVDGKITREVSNFDAYNRINKLMAQRTKEESGNYVVEKFTAIFEDKDADNLNLDVSEGIAYVDGYRLDIGATDITVPKARDTLEKLNEPVPATFGNYVYIEEGASGSQGFGRLASFGHQRLRTSSAGDYIGYCNVRAVQRDSTGVRLYIFNIRMDPKQGGGYHSFSEATILEDPTLDPNSPQIVMVDSVIHEAADNSLLFELPRTTPTKDSITANYTAQVTTTTQADGAGELTLSGVEQSQWIIAEEAGEILSISPDMTGKYTGLTPSQSYTIAYYVEKTNITPRSKTLTESVEYGSVTVSDQQGRPLFLDYVDGIKLKSVKYRPSAETGPWDDAEDITHQFTFDGGQRDNFYDRSVAYLKSGYVIPYDGVAKDVQVVYDYYAHEDKEGYFCAASYVDDAYEDIPKYTTVSGQIVCLRDVLDFRPTRDFLGPYLREFVVKTPLPQNASAISIDDVEYYLPRIDILVANAIDSRDGIGFGELQVIQGESAVSPREPQIPTGSMAMYKFRLNPYTFDRSDLSSVYIPNKRFTMKDIGELEKRIENLEITTLNLLESATVNLPIIDPDTGAEIIKTGIVADNFTSYLYSDVNNPNYRASQDPTGQLKPSFRQNSVRLSYSSDNVDAVVKNGDLVTLPFTSTSHILQDLATNIVNVNPFAVVSQVGTMELSPSSDEWIETRDLTPQMQTIERTGDGYIQDQYGDDLWDYGGGGAGILGYTQTGYISGADASMSLTVFDYAGTQVAGEEVTPYMRSRRINFVARGLRPNTKMFAFFGDKDVSSWVRQEATTQRFADDPQEFGSQYASATEYPTDLGGPSALQTDGSGKLVGSFFLPNTDTLKFRTGKQEFKLLDVSVNNENESTVSARASYSSTGSIDDVQQTIRTTRVVERDGGRSDPLAQTFFVDQIENPNGLFLTKVNLYLESKDATVPLQVQIRAVESGVPTNRIVPGSNTFVDPADITVTPFSSDTIMSEVQENATTVEFDEPIYLTSGEEYAIAILSESVEYNIYIAETYEFVVGSREDKVSRQAAAGSLFLSQNGYTWSPDQSKDLMFDLYRADFSTSGALVLDNAPLPKVALKTDPLETTSGSTSVKVYHEGHGFSRGDNVAISGVANAIGGVAASEFNGTFDIKSVNWDGYTIEVSASAPMSGVGGGDTVVASQQVYYDSFIPQIQSVIPNKTGVSAKLFDAKAKSYGGNSSNDSRSLGQFSYGLPSSLANARQVFLNDYNINGEPSIVASSENASGNETMKFNLQMTTSDTKVSPVIDLQRVSVLALENVVDYDVYNATADTPDYTTFGYAAQHISSAVTINDSSKSLKVMFSANRPPGSDFEVYVKVAADEDALLTTDNSGSFITNWIKVEIDKPLPEDDNPQNFRQYEYTAELDQFTAFQVKVVMHAKNSSKSPTIRDLRTISLVTGVGGNGSSTTTSSSTTPNSGTDAGNETNTDTGGETNTDTGGETNTDTGSETNEVRDISSLFAETVPTISASSRDVGREWSGTSGWEPRGVRFNLEFHLDGSLKVYSQVNATDVGTRTLVHTSQWLDRPIQQFTDGPANNFFDYLERFGITSTLKKINDYEIPNDNDPNDPIMSHTSDGVSVLRNKTIYDHVGDSFATNLSVSERGEMGSTGFILVESDMSGVSESTPYTGTVEMDIRLSPPTSEAFGGDLYEPAGDIIQTLTFNYDLPVGDRMTVDTDEGIVVAVAHDGVYWESGRDFHALYPYSPEMTSEEEGQATVQPIYIETDSSVNGTQHDVRFITYGIERPEGHNTHYYPITYTFGPEWSTTGTVTMNYGTEFVNTITSEASGNYSVNLSATHSGETFDWLDIPIGIRYTDEYRDAGGSVNPAWQSEDDALVFHH